MFLINKRKRHVLLPSLENLGPVLIDKHAGKRKQLEEPATRHQVQSFVLIIT